MGRFRLHFLMQRKGYSLLALSAVVLHHQAALSPPLPGLAWRRPGRFGASRHASCVTKCGDISSPRIAKNDAYLEAISEAWRSDLALGGAEPCRTKPFLYADEKGRMRLHGLIVYPRKPNGAGVILVHTAAGPRDMFLHWRAEVLAQQGFTCLIADMFGDEMGSAWDPDWSVEVRKPQADDRALSQARMRAAVDALASVAGVDADRIGALGYCFGGRAVLDLARLGSGAGVCVVVSFHGILDDGGNVPQVDLSTSGAPRILMCHGDADPFISAKGRAECEDQLRSCGARWGMLSFGGVRHGFTNPAQALNENPAFCYDRHAARLSWSAAEEVLQESLCQDDAPME